VRYGERGERVGMGRGGRKVGALSQGYEVGITDL